MYYILTNIVEIATGFSIAIIVLDTLWLVVERVMFSLGYSIVYRQSNSCSPIVTTCTLYRKDEHCYISGNCPEKVGAFMSKERGLYVGEDALKCSCMARRMEETFKDATTVEAYKSLNIIVKTLQEIRAEIEES